MIRNRTQKPLSAEKLRALLDYNPVTGLFHWKVNIGITIKIGDRAGHVDWRGYTYVGIDNGFYLAHRLAWLYMTGEWPTLHIDHIDNDKRNTAWANLRQADKSQNGANRDGHGASGLKGAYWHKAARRWSASVNCRGRYHYLGLFDSAEDAHDAYNRKAKELFGEFART